MKDQNDKGKIKISYSSLHGTGFIGLSTAAFYGDVSLTNKLGLWTGVDTGEPFCFYFIYSFTYF